MAASFRTAYAERLASGAIRPDPGQAEVVEAFARLEGELNALGEPGFTNWFRKPKAPKGIYLWGPVGRGKSMLMDLFFACAPVEKKQRSHFYAFMAEVHELVGAWRSGDASARKARFGQYRGDDPIAPVAELMEREGCDGWQIDEDRTLRELLEADGLRTLGAIMAVDRAGVLRGVVTVGRLRRAVQAAVATRP